MTTLGGLVLLAGLALTVLLVLRLVRPEAMERRGRNAWIGIRTGTTMRSDAAWTAAHRAAWPLVRRGSAVALGGTVLLGVVWLATGRSEDVLGLGVVAVVVVWTGFLLASVGPAHQAARDADG